jgi:hypothetical protein
LRDIERLADSLIEQIAHAAATARVLIDGLAIRHQREDGYE